MARRFDTIDMETPRLTDIQPPFLNHQATKQFDYQWHSVRQAQSAKVHPIVWSWLTEPGSITARLERMGKLTVQVIRDSWGQATPREQRCLHLRPREAVRVREVVLRFHDVPVIYARSIIPARSLVGHWRRLPKLGNRPLGGYLFRNRTLVRGPIEIAQLPSTLFHQVCEPVWARRSVFYHLQQGILVSEAFLPAILSLDDLSS